MTGTIEYTNSTGGAIVTSDRRRFRFRWCDCNFQSSDAGHYTPVEFTPRKIGDVDHAVNVRSEVAQAAAEVRRRSEVARASAKKLAADNSALAESYRRLDAMKNQPARRNLSTR